MKINYKNQLMKFTRNERNSIMSRILELSVIQRI